MYNINSVLWINKKNYSCKDDSKLDNLHRNRWMKFSFIDVNNFYLKTVLGKLEQKRPKRPSFSSELSRV